MNDYKQFFANIEKWSNSLDEKIKSKEFLLNRDAAVFGLIFSVITKNPLITMVAWIGGHWINIDKLQELFLKYNKAPIE